MTKKFKVHIDTTEFFKDKRMFKLFLPDRNSAIPEFPFLKFGYKKAKVLVENIEALKEYVELCEKGNS